MTIHAYTEPQGSYPAYVNLKEEPSGLFSLTVRTQGDGGRNVASIKLAREQLLNLVNDASEYLDQDPQANKNAVAAKNMAMAESRHASNPGLRMHALEMALRTPGLKSHDDVLAAATAYQAHIEGKPAMATPMPSAGIDIQKMVDRFLSWKLPETFGPDCFVSFDRMAAKHSGSWPVGTNLFNADEARAMFEYVLPAD
jgi:hypothetical protein